MMYSGNGPFSGMSPTWPTVPQQVNTKSPARTCCALYFVACSSLTNTNPSGTNLVRSSRRLLPRITGTPEPTKNLELIFDPNGPATQDDFSGDLMSSTVTSFHLSGIGVLNSG